MDEEYPLRPFPFGDRVYETRLTRKFEARAPYTPPKKNHLRCVIPGLIHSLLVKEGDKVAEGQPLLILEAMKMHNEIRAPFAGTVRRIRAAAGTTVAKGDVLIEFTGA